MTPAIAPRPLALVRFRGDWVAPAARVAGVAQRRLPPPESRQDGESAPSPSETSQRRLAPVYLVAAQILGAPRAMGGHDASAAHRGRLAYARAAAARPAPPRTLDACA